MQDVVLSSYVELEAKPVQGVVKLQLLLAAQSMEEDMVQSVGDANLQHQKPWQHVLHGGCRSGSKAQTG